MATRRPSSLAFLAGVGTAAVAGHLALWAVFPPRLHMGGFLAIYAGLCALSAGTALWLRSAVDQQPPPGGEPALERLILAFAACLRLVAVRGPAPFSTDVYRYVWDGRVQAAGVNPYIYPPAAPELAFLRDGLHPLINHPDLTTIYPPLAQWAFRAAAAVSPTVSAQKALFAGLDLAACWALLGLLRARRRPPAWAVLYAWHPLPVIEFAGSGHLDSLMLLLLVVALYALERGRPLAGSAGLAAAAMAKAAPLVMLPWLAVQRRWRILAVFFGTAAACALPFAAGIREAAARGVPLFTGPRAYAGAWLANPSLFAALDLAVADPPRSRCLLAGALAALSLPWALANRDRPTAYALGALFALLLASPVVQPWYVLWLLPLLCVHPLWSGLAWTWLVGFQYVVLAPRLAGASAWGQPVWAWAWLLQYGVVYALLLAEAGGRIFGGCNEDGLGRHPHAR